MASFYDLHELPDVDCFRLDMAQRPLAPWAFLMFGLLCPAFAYALHNDAGLLLFALLFPLTVLAMMGACFWHPRARFEVSENRFVAIAWMHYPLPWPQLLELPVHQLEVNIEPARPWRALHHFTLVVRRQGQVVARIPSLGANQRDLIHLGQRVAERQPRAAERHGEGEGEVPALLMRVVHQHSDSDRLLGPDSD